jgi:hypothetical protein
MKVRQLPVIEDGEPIKAWIIDEPARRATPQRRQERQ